MKRMTIAIVHQIVCVALCSAAALAQGYDDPLTIQGLDQTTLQSAASRGAGGISLGVEASPGMMFTNPAVLRSIRSVRLSVGGLDRSRSVTQEQHYAPLKYYSNFSLLMEGLTGTIPDPDSLHPGQDAGDTVQRPFDDIGPNWSRSKNAVRPIQALLVVPFSLGEREFTVGAGVVQYADLNHYYQNNNVLSPSIGSERPIPTPLPPNNPDSTVATDWFQYIRSREGSIRGYGAAFSGALTDNISFGLSGMLLRGSTDDEELRMGRGILVFYANYFRLDSLPESVTQTGTSDYSGEEATLSGMYTGRHVSVGFSIHPRSTIRREYTRLVRTDTNGAASSVTVTGRDKVTLPWRGTVGLAIAVRENISLAFEYEFRPYASAVYEAPDGTESRPWLSSSVLHAGAEYRPLTWLALRAGIRGESEVFEPVGNPIIGEPAGTSIYSAGCGVAYGPLRLNVAYEYASLKYQDIWQTNVNLNHESRHTVIADVSYELPWRR